MRESFPSLLLCSASPSSPSSPSHQSKHLINHTFFLESNVPSQCRDCQWPVFEINHHNHHRQVTKMVRKGPWGCGGTFPTASAALAETTWERLVTCGIINNVSKLSKWWPFRRNQCVGSLSKVSLVLMCLRCFDDPPFKWQSWKTLRTHCFQTKLFLAQFC